MDKEPGYAELSSLVIRGCKAARVTVSATVEAPGLPSMNLDGVGERVATEFRSAIRCAIRSAGYEMPRAAVRVELSAVDGRPMPYGFPTGLELPVAAAMLAASGQIPEASIEGRVLTGDLAHDGEVLPSRGLHLFQREIGAGGALLTSSKVDGKALPERLGGCPALGIGNLSALREGPQAQEKMETVEIAGPDVDMADVRIDEKTARAIEVACAGGHNLLLYGSDFGFVKRVAERVATCLPVPSAAECGRAAAVESVVGDFRETASLGPRPCITWDADLCSLGSLVGGGRPVRPGAVSRADGGVLVIENMSKISDVAAHMLNSIIRDKSVRLVRADGKFTMPANAMVIGCMEPGAKLSEPLRNSTFVCVEVNEREDDGCTLTSAEIMERVVEARAFARDATGRREAISDEPWDLVARTVADLEGSHLVDVDHQREALEMTKPDTWNLFNAAAPVYAPERSLDELEAAATLESSTASAAQEDRAESLAREDGTR